MIVTRTKYFTKANQEMIKEILEQTDNLKNLPKGAKNMSLKDLLKLSDVTESIGLHSRFKSSGEHPDSVIKNAEEVLENIGLSKTSKNIKHALNKYINTDPAVLERFIKMKSKSLGKSNEEIKELLEKSSEDKFIIGGLKDLVLKSKYNKLRPGINTKVDKNISDVAGYFNDGIEGLKEAINGSVVKSNDQDKQKLLDKIKKGIEVDYGKIVKSTNSPEKVSNNPIKKEIVVMDSIPMIAHEIGHDRWSKRTKTSPQKVHHPFQPLTIEAGASIDGLSYLKKLGATEKDLDDSKDVLKKAYMNYYHDSIYDFLKEQKDKFSPTWEDIKKNNK